MRSKSLVAMCATFTMVAACASGDDPDDAFDTFPATASVTAGNTSLEGSESGEGDGDGDDPTTTTTTDPSGDGDGDDPTTTATTDDPTMTDDPTTDDPTTGDGDGDGDIPIEPNNMIDNFEDGDGALLPLDGRQGYWYTFNDESVGATQTPASDMVLPSGGGAKGTSMAMHTTGSGFAVWGAGVGIDFNNMGGDNGIKMAYNASGFTGIVVMAKGNGQVRASVQLLSTISPAEGGTCELDCDPHGMVLNLTGAWQQFVLPFNSLSQEGWGTPAVWDATTTAGLQFKVSSNVDFDFWVDEVGFY